MSQKICIRKIQPSDDEATEMARIQLRSFAGQNIRLLFFPRGKESESEEFAYRKGQIFRGAYDSEKHWIVAISETASSDGARLENIIGYCLWIAPPTPGQVKSDEEKARERQVALSYRPESMDREYNDKIVTEQEKLLERLMGQNPADYWSKLPLVSFKSCHSLRLTMMCPIIRSWCPLCGPGAPAERSRSDVSQMGT